MNERSKSRSAARLAAVQALYQLEMEGTPIRVLLHEFHQHRLGATIEDVTYAEAEESFFDDLVIGVDKRREEIDGLVKARLSQGWSLERLDKPMRQILRAGSYELIARARMCPPPPSSANMSMSPTPFTTSARQALSTGCWTRWRRMCGSSPASLPDAHRPCEGRIARV